MTQSPVPALPSARTAWRARLLALLLGIALAWGTGEAGFRIASRGRGFYDVEMWRYSRLLKEHSPLPDVGHWHRPNARARLYGVDIATNSHGLRGPEIGEQRSPGTLRIAVLGDSLTLGWGVPEADTFCERFARRLASTAPRGITVEVLNFGIGNFNTRQEAALYAGLARRFHPDEVVLGYFINDAEELTQASEGRDLLGSELLVFVWSRLARFRARTDPNAGYRTYYRDLYRDDAKGWRDAQAALARLASDVAADGARLTVTLLPELHELPAVNPFAREYQLVAELARKDGADVIDPWPRFRGRAPEPLWVSSEDQHPSSEAHALIADALFDHWCQTHPNWGVTSTGAGEAVPPGGGVTP